MPSVDTVNDLSPRVQYIAAAAQTDFDYPFPIFEDDNLVVLIGNVSQTLTTDYTVSGEGNDAGGTLTFLAPRTAGEIVTIYRDIPIERITDFATNGPLSSATFNDELDRVTMLLQQLESRIGRSLRLPITGEATNTQTELSPIDNWLGKYIYIDSNGIPQPATVVASTTLSQSTIGAFFQPITAEETAIGLVLGDLTTFWPVGNPRRYGAVGDGVANDVTAIQRAIDTREEGDGGLVAIDHGTYRIASSPINWKQGVRIVGAGPATIIKADNVNGFEINILSQGFGNLSLESLYIQGVNGTTRTAVKQVGTLNDADEVYGVTLRDVLITDFNIGVDWRTVRNGTIDNCWFQHVNKGIRLLGKNLVIDIVKTKLTYGNGNGTGAVIGLELDGFDYTAGTGFVAPEGVHFSNGQIFGFDTCVLVTFVNYAVVSDCDLSGRFYGIRFITAQNLFVIRDVFVEMSSANALWGIKGDGLASIIPTKVIIDGCNVIGSGTTIGCGGIQINDSGNTNQDRVTIRSTVIQGMQSFDVQLHNPGDILIDDVLCLSTSVTESIKVGARQRGLITIRDSTCVGGIEAEAADCLAGHVRIIDCVDDGTATKHAEAIGWYEEGTWTPADASGAGLVFAGVVGTYTKQGNVVRAQAQFTYPTTVDGSSNTISGLPYALPATGESRRQGQVSYSDLGTLAYVRPALSTSQFVLRKADGSLYSNAELSQKTFTLIVEYTVN